MSSVANSPGEIMATPDVTISGLFVPSSTLPIASMARGVDPAVLREFREIVDEGEMNHTVRILRGGLKTVEILQRAPMDLGAHLLERFCVCIGARKAHNLMTIGEQFFRRRGADESGRAGHENAHEETPSLFS